MANALVIAPRAEADLATTFAWYEERSLGLGQDFMRCVEAKLAVIVRAPQLFRKRSGQYRLAATVRFPYAIYFVWDEVHARIAIRRVLHFAQNSHDAL